jgi:hypothetical protein
MMRLDVVGFLGDVWYCFVDLVGVSRMLDLVFGIS